jgi:hypothetical protein
VGCGDRAVTPETRAARDRIALLLDPDTARFPTIGFRPGSRNPTCEEVYTLIVQHDELIRSMIAPDLAVVLAALDRYEQIEESVLETARQVAEHAARFGPVPERVEVTYQVTARECEGCGCCSAAGCHRGPDSLCPTNSLGESVCPCTED